MRLSPYGYLLLAILAAVPVLAVEVPPLVDYPNHLARMHILATLGEDPVLSDNYAIDWRPIPNLAMDLIVPPLVRVLSVFDAGRLFLLLAFGAIVGGVCALHRVVHGTLGLWPAASFLTLYNLPLGWGFLNFYFSVGLFLLLLAGWIATRQWSATLRLLLFNVGTAALYLSHLFGLAAFVLAVFLYECHAAFDAGDRRVGTLARRCGVALASFAAPALLYLCNRLLWDSGLPPLALGNWYGDVFTKLSALLSAFVLYGGWPDGLVLVLAAGLLIVIRLCSGRVNVAPALRWHLVIFLIAALAAPHVFRGIFLDARIGLVLACLLVAAVRITISSRRVASALFVAMACVFAVKAVTVHGIWTAYDSAYDEFRAALHVVEPGARIISAHDVSEASPGLSYDVRWRMAQPALSAGLPPSLAYRGLINLAVIERGAFVPSLFTYPSAQPVRSTPRNQPVDPVQPARRITTALLLAGVDNGQSAGLAATATEHGERAFWIDWPQQFDFVVLFRYGVTELVNPAPALMESTASGSFFDIYRVRK